MLKADQQSVDDLGCEIPDESILCQAEQFLKLAELGWQEIRKVVAPSPIVCNATFAIELMLKSLNSHWHEAVGTGSCTVVTIANNRRRHHLGELLREVPSEIRESLESEFRSGDLYKSQYDERTSLESILDRYGDAFKVQRYMFEKLEDNFTTRLPEIVRVARFLFDVIGHMPRKRC